jgi:hypothetical protein
MLRRLDEELLLMEVRELHAESKLKLLERLQSKVF